MAATITEHSARFRSVGASVSCMGFVLRDDYFMYNSMRSTTHHQAGAQDPVAMRKKLPTWSALAALGMIALALLIGLGIFLWTRDTEVEQLMEILAAGDPADTAWAFEKLKVVDYRDLDQFLPYLTSTRPTTLELLARTFLHQGAVRTARTVGRSLILGSGVASPAAPPRPNATCQARRSSLASVVDAQ